MSFLDKRMIVMNLGMIHLDYVRTMLESSGKCWIKLEFELSPTTNFVTLGIKLNKVKVLGKLCYKLKV